MVKAVLDRHEAAFSAQDLKGLMDTYALDPEIVFMGNGPGQIWIGKKEIEAAYIRFFTQFEPGTLNIDYDSFLANFRCDVAWFAAECRAKGQVKKKKKVREIAFNLSGTLMRQEDKWVLTALHFSHIAGVRTPGGRKRR